MPYFFLENHLVSGNEPVEKRSENRTQETPIFKPLKRMRRSKEQNRRKQQMGSQKSKEESRRTGCLEEGMREDWGRVRSGSHLIQGKQHRKQGGC